MTFLSSASHLSIRSLTLDNKNTVEKEQVIKLIRAIVEIGSHRVESQTPSTSGKVMLSESVMRAFVAVAEQPDDPFKNICVQTLAEIRKVLSLIWKPSILMIRDSAH